MASTIHLNVPDNSLFSSGFVVKNTAADAETRLGIAIKCEHPTVTFDKQDGKSISFATNAIVGVEER
jgi:hypothetical protein